jgi:formate dehydrogenase maturation protein FdhE
MTVASESWDSRIQRAVELSSTSDATKEILTFYAKLLQSQKEVDEFLRSRRGWLPSGSLSEDLSVARECLPIVLRTVAANGPEPLAEEARTLITAAGVTLDEMLLDYWRSSSDSQFFAKAFLQPYARWLAESGGHPVDRMFEARENRCPFCGGLPQVSSLRITEPSSESGNRDLICAVCTTTWRFRRVACAFCNEEQPTKLGYFHTPEYDHVRIESCDTCNRYIKGIDLTRLGFAVPLVDELAAAALDVWARERGFTKIELNLVGL